MTEAPPPPPSEPDRPSEPAAGSTPPPPPPSGGYSAPPPPPPPGGDAGYGGYGAPQGATPTGGPSQLSPQDERTWGMLAHISALIAGLIALSFLGPLLVMLIQGPKSAFVRRHSVEALNFQITTYIAAIASAILIVVVIGILLLVVVGIGWLVLTIMAGVAASKGEEYRYPINLRLVK